MLFTSAQGPNNATPRSPGLLLRPCSARMKNLFVLRLGPLTPSSAAGAGHRSCAVAAGPRAWPATVQLPARALVHPQQARPPRAAEAGWGGGRQWRVSGAACRAGCVRMHEATRHCGTHGCILAGRWRARAACCGRRGRRGVRSRSRRRRRLCGQRRRHGRLLGIGRGAPRALGRRGLARRSTRGRGGAWGRGLPLRRRTLGTAPLGRRWARRLGARGLWRRRRTRRCRRRGRVGCRRTRGRVLAGLGRRSGWSLSVCRRRRPFAALLAAGRGRHGRRLGAGRGAGAIRASLPWGRRRA